MRDLEADAFSKRKALELEALLPAPGQSRSRGSCLFPDGLRSSDLDQLLARRIEATRAQWRQSKHGKKKFFFIF